MSRPSDYDYEMTDDVLADEAIEAFFLGLPHIAWEQDEVLAALATDIGAAMDASPPTPDHSLLKLFWAGEPVGRAEVGARAAVAERVAGVTPRGAPVVIRRRGRRLLGSVAAGMTAVTLGIGTAGATGVLPAPAQRVVARVVEAVSPLELPEPTREGHPDGSSPGGGARVAEGGTQAPAIANKNTTTVPSRPGPETAPSAVSPTMSPVPEAASSRTELGHAPDTPAAGPVQPPRPQPPSAGHAPGSSGGTPSSWGVDRARDTPGGTAVPPSPPVPPRPGPPRQP